MTRDRVAAALALVLAGLSVAWLDPHARAREGNRLYAEGKFDDAAAKYNEALVDDPDSSRLHFNLGDAEYRQGKFDDAVKAFQQVPPTDDDKARTSRVAYNAGNALYKLGAATADAKPQEALGRWAEAIAMYRRALGADPGNVDAKFNHEFVAKKIEELQKKLEDQKKQQQDQQQKQDQQGQDQNQQPPQQQNPDKHDQQADQQNPGQQQDAQQPEKQNDQQQAAQPKPEPQPDQQQPGASQPGERADGGQQPATADADKKPGEMSPQEARAVLDGERTDEVRPDEVVRRLQHAGVAEPTQDW
jgi:Ca-activated chloride channel family protein